MAPTNAVIIERIENLKTTIDKGFKDVNNRLDKLNGNVAEHEKRIGSLEGYNNNKEKFEESGWKKTAVIVSIISVMTSIGTWLIINFFKGR